MRKPKEPKYKLIISTDSYTGNFERELVGYTLGILDSVQMEIDHSRDYREAFRRQEGLESSDSRDFHDEYLFERYQEVDDWEQYTFYEIGCYTNNQCNDVAIFFKDIPEPAWEERIIRRIKLFFDGDYKKIEDADWQKQFGHPAPYDKYPKLESIEWLENGNLFKKVL
jgi:hypothetical protein